MSRKLPVGGCDHADAVPNGQASRANCLQLPSEEVAQRVAEWLSGQGIACQHQAAPIGDTDFRALFMGAPDAMLVQTLDDAVVDANPAACRLFGYTREELCRLQVQALHPPESWHARQNVVRDELSAGAVMDDVCIDREGKRFPVAITTTGLHSGGGVLTVSIIRDMSERRHMLDALRESEARFKDFAATAADWFWETDAQFRITQVEGRFQEVMGIGPDSVLGRTRREILEGDHAVAADWDEHDRLMTAQLPIVDFEYVFPHGDGSRRWIRMNARPYYGVDGRFKGFRGSARDFSSEQRTRRALMESENLFRAVFDNAGIGMLVIDPAGHILRTNATFCTMLGYNSLELAGRHFADITHPDDLARSWVHFPQAGQMFEGTHEFEKRHLRKDGNEVWARVLSSLARNAAGEPTFVIGTVEDISSRRQMHEALRRSEQQLRLVMDNAPMGIYLKDREGRYLLINCTTARVLRLSPEAARGKLPSNFFGPDVCAAIEQHEREVRASRGMVVRQFKRELSGGGVSIIESIKFPILDEHGEPVGLGGIDMDVTERYQTEDALRQSEEHFRQLVEHLDEGVLLLDPASGEPVYANPAAGALWGVSAEELVAMPELARGRAQPDEHCAGQIDAQAGLRGQPGDIEYRLRRRHGEPRWVWERSVPLRNSQGQVLRIIAIMKDVTARRLAEEQRLERAREQRDALLREVHHRIKNSLQGVSGLLREHAARNPQLAVALEGATRQLDAVAVVHGLQGRTAGERVTLTDMLRALVRGSAGRMAWIETGGDATALETLEVDADEAAPVALVASELIVNAIKHADCNPDQPAARVSLHGTPDGAVVEVRNAAAGLPFDFDFQRGSGVGTGLELVRALLPPEGATLDFEFDGHDVVARLDLRYPVVVSSPHPV